MKTFILTTSSGTFNAELLEAKDGDEEIVYWSVEFELKNGVQGSFTTPHWADTRPNWADTRLFQFISSMIDGKLI